MREYGGVSATPQTILPDPSPISAVTKASSPGRDNTAGEVMPEPTSNRVAIARS
jgi:hypothetical protein